MLLAEFWPCMWTALKFEFTKCLPKDLDLGDEIHKLSKFLFLLEIPLTVGTVVIYTILTVDTLQGFHAHELNHAQTFLHVVNRRWCPESVTVYGNNLLHVQYTGEMCRQVQDCGAKWLFTNTENKNIISEILQVIPDIKVCSKKKYQNGQAIKSKDFGLDEKSIKNIANVIKP